MPHSDNLGWISKVLGREITPGPPMTSVDDLIARRAFWDLAAFAVDQPREVERLHERVVIRELDGAVVSAEIIVPRGEAPFPIVLYLHGGWFCMWSAAHVRRLAYRIAARGHVVCSLDYRLAPEHPFPAAIEDVVYAGRWLTRHGGDFHGDTSRIAIAGDSVGATLAAAANIALLESREEIEGGDLAGVDVSFVAAAMLYGVLDYPLLMAEPGSNAGIIELAGNLAYLGPTFLRYHRHPLISPVYASSLERFPPCYLTCGDEDSLLPQTLSMTKALTAANVPTTVSILAGADHGFPYAEASIPGAPAEVDRLVDWLAAHTGAAQAAT